MHEIPFYPSLQILMRTDQISKSDWSELDDIIKPLLKKTLGLPSNEYFYGNRDDGLMSIPRAAEDSDILHIDGGSSC